MVLVGISTLIYIGAFLEQKSVVGYLGAGMYWMVVSDVVLDKETGFRMLNKIKN